MTHAQPKIADIKKAVADEFGITVEDLDGANQEKKFSLPRHVAMYLCRNFTEHSFPVIGREFGGRDHTTVISGIRSAEIVIDRMKKIQSLLSKFEGGDWAKKGEAVEAPPSHPPSGNAF